MKWCFSRRLSTNPIDNRGINCLITRSTIAASCTAIPYVSGLRIRIFPILIRRLHKTSPIQKPYPTHPQHLTVHTPALHSVDCVKLWGRGVRKPRRAGSRGKGRGARLRFHRQAPFRAPPPPQIFLTATVQNTNLSSAPHQPGSLQSDNLGAPPTALHGAKSQSYPHFCGGSLTKAPSAGHIRFPELSQSSVHFGGVPRC